MFQKGEPVVVIGEKSVGGKIETCLLLHGRVASTDTFNKRVDVQLDNAYDLYVKLYWNVHKLCYENREKVVEGDRFHIWRKSC